MAERAAAGRTIAVVPHAVVPHAAVHHGGNVADAVARYGIPRDQWLDLSTGINPHGYPVPPVPPEAWRCLPDDGAALTECAARHYGAPHALLVAGSQAAIRALPQILPRGNVGLASLTYGEYRPAFERAGHRVATFDPHLPDQALPPELLHLVVVNPNNPSATHWPAATLLHWRDQLFERGGTLLVDEAFVDTMPTLSVAAATGEPGLIVLRSIGKFFGLAGARAGFVLADPALLNTLAAILGVWTVSGAACHAVRAALADHAWQSATRERLQHDGKRLLTLLATHGLDARGTPLFAWARHSLADSIHEHLARLGIWTRRFEAPASLRFGLPGEPAAWARLDAALETCAALPRMAHTPSSS